MHRCATMHCASDSLLILHSSEQRDIHMSYFVGIDQMLDLRQIDLKQHGFGAFVRGTSNIISKHQWDHYTRREHWILKFIGKSCRIYMGRGTMKHVSLIVDREDHCAKCRDKAIGVFYSVNRHKLRKDYNVAELMCESCREKSFLQEALINPESR